MASSTSSFDRSALVLGLAALLVLGMAGLNALRPDPGYADERADRLFWQRKVYGFQPHGYTIVAAGDSRVYRGFSPDTVENILPGARVVNDGYSSGGHNPLMFRRIEHLLEKDGGEKPRAVILGITPMSLTPKAQENAAYNDYFRKGEPTSMEPVEDFFRPLTPGRIKRIIQPREAEKPYANYERLDNGWVRSDWLKRSPQSALKSYANGFDGNKVDPAVIATLMEQVKTWTGKGITVIAYRPPTTPAMIALENEKSGFDESAFARRFTEAGGIWVTPEGVFESYDGSHLTPESTVKLSEILARAIAGAGK